MYGMVGLARPPLTGTSLFTCHSPVVCTRQVGAEVGETRVQTVGRWSGLKVTWIKIKNKNKKAAGIGEARDGSRGVVDQRICTP